MVSPLINSQGEDWALLQPRDTRYVVHFIKPYYDFKLASIRCILYTIYCTLLYYILYSIHVL